MKLSLSVRIAESPRRKDIAAVPIETVAASANAAGFSGLSMRASVLHISSSVSRVAAVRQLLDGFGLRVSMVTGDLPLAINNSEATAVLRNITPYLDLATALGSNLVRVMMHNETDIDEARRASDIAAERGIRLSHQMHWGSLFETVDGALETIRRVDRPNFGVTYEPANLLACGEDYGPYTIARLAPHIFNAYFQNIRLDPESPVIFETRSRGAVGVRFVPLNDPLGIDPTLLLQALKLEGYDGWISIHQPLLDHETVECSIDAAARQFLPLI
jgi:sugar phosphate isomerase/epimerase